MFLLLGNCSLKATLFISDIYGAVVSLTEHTGQNNRDGLNEAWQHAGCIRNTYWGPFYMDK